MTTKSFNPTVSCVSRKTRLAGHYPGGYGEASTGVGVGAAPHRLASRSSSDFEAFQTVPRLSLKRRLLHVLHGTLHYSGVGALYVHTQRVAGAVILMYHSVAPARDAAWIDPCNHTTPALFERQARFLARHRSVVSMTQLVEAVEHGRALPAGTVVITFDDGYLDCLTIAAPILKRYGLSAALYLPTEYINRGATQWIDRLYTMFRVRTNDRLALEFDGRQTFDLRDSRQRLMAYRRVATRLAGAESAVREQLLVSVAGQLAPGAQPPQLTLNWDDVRRLQRAYTDLEIGVHSAEHLDLSAQSETVARTEIERCVADFERELDCRPAHFSFPYNRSTERVRQVVKEVGLRSAVASGRSVLIGVGADPFFLPRAAAPRSMALLRFMTSGAYPGLSDSLVGHS
jgi:peptidoglycan/xylan/chitin deacetylase (PgdA/CDA1 family)